MSVLLSDPASERAVLAGICQYGASAYYDVADMLQESTFNTEPNNLIFRCLVHLIRKDDNIKVDIPMIHDAAREMGFSHILIKSEEVKHLNALMNFPVELSNVRRFAAKIRKLEIAKLLHAQLEQSQQNILGLKGDETVAHILGLAEEPIFNFCKLLNDGSDSPDKLGKNIVEHFTELAENPVDCIGIPSGFPIYDAAIGGGFREGTINVIGARPKTGKTVLSDNMGYNITKNIKIPVLNMDTEMLKEDHQYRMAARIARVPINDIETGKFAKIPSIRQKVMAAAQEVKELPYYHKSIAGMPQEDQFALMRRWIAQVPGLKADGTANRCVIIYDYLKLMDATSINGNIAEFQALGFFMTTLHNFAVRYKIPIVAFIQLNRDGITKETTDAASGSDRIVWLCSNFTIFKKKSDEEIAEDGAKVGNRKLVPVACRHGAGLESGDYINCKMEGAFASVTECQTKMDSTVDSEDDGFIIEEEYDDIPFDA